MGTRSETLQLLHEFIRAVKKLGFQAVQNGEGRTLGTLIIHGDQCHTLLSQQLFCPLCKEFLAQLPGPGQGSVLAHPSHLWVNCEEFLIRIPRECNNLPLWLSLERWGCASRGSEVLLGFGTTTAS